MGLEWADEQTLRWPIQDLQPWANRAASDGPMKGQCIRAIWALLYYGLKEHFMIGYISEGSFSTYHGYLLLNREMNIIETKILLEAHRLFFLQVVGITKSSIRLEPASELNLTWNDIDNIRREDGEVVSFGNWKLFEAQADNQVTLQYPTSYSRYLLSYRS